MTGPTHHPSGHFMGERKTAGLAKGFSTVRAVKEAKDYVTFAIKNSFDLGSGHGPLNHFWKID